MWEYLHKASLLFFEKIKLSKIILRGHVEFAQGEIVFGWPTETKNDFLKLYEFFKEIFLRFEQRNLKHQYL